MAHQFKKDALSHANPVHIKSIVDAVLRLYFSLCGCTHVAVYGTNNPDGETQDWDELQALLEQVYDGVPAIRRWRGDGELEERIPDTERGA